MKSYNCISQKKIKSGHYSISAIQQEHIESIRIWRNKQIDILRQKKLINSIEQKNYFENNVWPEMKFKKPSKILVSYYKNIKIIGYGGLVNITWKKQEAELSFLLSPDRCIDKKVYENDFSIFIKLIKELAFEILNFKSLITETYDIRPNHIDILEKNNFIKKKVLKKNIKINDKLINSVFHYCQKS